MSEVRLWLGWWRFGGAPVMGWRLGLLVVPVQGGICELEQEKGIRWMPWHQEAMKDVARCENPGGAASKL